MPGEENMAYLDKESFSANNLDFLLEEICIALQLTDTQYYDAEEKYTAIGKWLAQPDSPLSLFQPEIYPQGSMALQTTVKPRQYEEYDLDLVLQIQQTNGGGPMALYEAVYNRLKDHEGYAQKIQRMRRCIRLNYANQFHLDILPACIDESRGGTCIKVPDRKLERWKPSNPKGYRDWFEQRCSQVIAFAKKMQTPLPDNTPAQLKAILKRVVQLIKRHRDIYFQDKEDAPRSVILTTLTAHYYKGDLSISEALLAVLNNITEIIKTALPERIQVYNPTNEDELFSESWTTKSYQEFEKFIYAFRDKMEKLVVTQGLDKIGEELSVLFGEEVGIRAVKSFMAHMNEAHDTQRLRFTATGLTTAVGSGRTIPKHTFYGK
jgi:hypothetical protein